MCDVFSDSGINLLLDAISSYFYERLLYCVKLMSQECIARAVTMVFNKRTHFHCQFLKTKELKFIDQLNIELQVPECSVARQRTYATFQQNLAGLVTDTVYVMTSLDGVDGSISMKVEDLDVVLFEYSVQVRR